MGVLDKFRIDGKIALVTGCSQGIGFAIAEGLAEAGADIIGVAYNFEPQGSEIEQAVTALGRKFSGYACDFSKRAELLAFLKQVHADHPRIDILFNNAGTIRRKPAAEHPDEYWDEVIEVNLNAQFLITREIGRKMVERGSGKVVFTASLLSYQGGITVPGYAASKGGVKQLTMAFANEWAGQGVNVNAIAPGYIATANTKALREDAQRSAAILERIPRRPLGRARGLQGPGRLPRKRGRRLLPWHGVAHRRRLDGALTTIVQRVPRMACPPVPSSTGGQATRGAHRSSLVEIDTMSVNLFDQLERLRLIPIVTLDDARHAAPLAEALARGGLPCAEGDFPHRCRRRCNSGDATAG